MKQRQASLSRRAAKWRQSSINVQDMQVRRLESPDSTLSPGTSRFNTSRLQTQRDAKPKDLVDIVGTMSLKPDVVKRLHTTKNAPPPIRNFDLFSKEN